MNCAWYWDISDITKIAKKDELVKFLLNDEYIVRVNKI